MCFTKELFKSNLELTFLGNIFTYFMKKSTESVICYKKGCASDYFQMPLIR